MKYFTTILLTLLAGSGWASDRNTDALPEQQQLQQLLDEIDKNRQERAQHRAMLQRLEQQQVCNWSLIQEYEACKQHHSTSPPDHLLCTRQAKDTAAACLAERLSTK
jgi:hypothetical protein